MSEGSTASSATSGSPVNALASAPRRLRIVHVVPTYYPAVRYGGPIRSVHGLCKALVARGHEVHVYTSSMDGRDDLDVPLVDPVDMDGVRIHYFRVPALRRLCWCPALGTTLARDIDGFDVLHLHSVFLWPTFAAARIAARAGVPYVVSPRGMLGRTVIESKSRLVKTAWIRLIERRTLLQAAAVHATAELEAAEIRGLGLPVPRMICVPNGVDWPAESRPGAGSPLADPRQPYALFLSRLDPKKGLDRLIEAWRWVPDLDLVIAGNDESGYRRELDRMVERAGLQARVRFIGAVADEHKWTLYANAVLFLLPSYSENFGNVVAEAMAMGCPVVVTPEVGIARLVQETGAGLVCAGDPRLLAEGIRSLVADFATRVAMGERGRRAAHERLSWHGCARDMEAAYLAAMAAAPARASRRTGAP